MPSTRSRGGALSSGGPRGFLVAKTAGDQLYDASGATHSTLFSGTGAPAAGLGKNGDVYFRDDTPGTANQRVYTKSGGSWTGVL